MAALIRNVRLLRVSHSFFRQLPIVCTSSYVIQPPTRNVATNKNVSFHCISGNVQQISRCPFCTTAKALEDIQQRVLNVCRAYDKITADKVTLESHFMKDLGLDSLDHVEVIMAVEDEFGFEIPDTEAERMLKPADIVKYISEKSESED